jgi:hypothetical protein
MTTEGSTVTNPAPGQPPAPGSAWPQQGAQQQPAQQQQPTALLPAAQPRAPHQPAPEDATIRLPRVQPGPPPQYAFTQPPVPQGPHQAWPPQAPGYPPGVPGQPGRYGAAPPSRKPTRILIGVVAAVVVLGVLVTGVVLTMRQASTPPPAPDVVASPLDELTPESAAPVPGPGDTDTVLAELSVSLQSDLNDRDVEGLLATVCEDGKTGDAARNDLLEFPFLDPTSSQYSDPIDFQEGSVSANDVEDDGSYLIDFVGSYTSTEEPIELTFKAYVYPDGSGAVWCGVA